ncbi:phage tailspike protein [Serratia fonticola]|uniref:phage tailspike protein n=1 Tax=Serratia fonticola TaxID=47917 RepID=UPI001FCE5CD5|nr:phage tailspike protein [Serratia fonticola]
MADPIVPNVVVSMPAQNFTLARSFKAAANGKIYIGKIDTDPTIPENQIQVYIQNEDDSLVPIAQPIVINTGGYPVYGGQISKFVTVEGHSMAVYDAYNVQQFYFPNVLRYNPDQFAQRLNEPDGLKYVGRCPDIAKLRMIEPTQSLQLIDVAEYVTGGNVGGGYFVYDATDTTSTDNGGSVIVTPAGARWKRRIDQLLPVHFGAVPGNTADSTEPLRRYIAASARGTVDFRGSFWTISGTLDLTAVATVIADNSCVFQVSQSGFSGSWVITFGDPALPYNQGRASRVTITGSLVVDGLNRGSALNGIYLKGQWFNVGHIRASKFNGTGVQQTAVWDSTIDRISVELCGNSTSFAYVQSGGGDTHNATHLKALQVEQSYNKAIAASGIRDVIDNIHCERTYITTLNDGTATLPSGLNYITCSFGLGNSVINQGIIDAYPGATAPDGSACVTSSPSIVLSMDYSTMNNIAAAGAIISCSFGRQVEYNGFTAKDFYVSEPAEKVTLRSPRIIGTLFLGSEIMVENGIINKFTPRNNAYNILISGGAITTIEYTQNIRGLITLNNVTVSGDILDLKAPTGSGAGTSVGALYPPTVFNNCNLNKVAGFFGSRATFNGGHIATVALESQCAFEFYNTKIGTFGYTGNRAFITRGVQADTATNWTAPAHYIWPAGTLTERVGYASGSGIIYVSKSSTAVDFGPIVSS